MGVETAATFISIFSLDVLHCLLPLQENTVAVVDSIPLIAVKEKAGEREVGEVIIETERSMIKDGGMIDKHDSMRVIGELMIHSNIIDQENHMMLTGLGWSHGTLMLVRDHGPLAITLV